MNDYFIFIKIECLKSLQKFCQLFRLCASGIADIESGGSDAAAQAVNRAKTLHVSEDKTGVEIVARAGGQHRFFAIGSVHIEYLAADAAGSAFNGMYD